MRLQLAISFAIFIALSVAGYRYIVAPLKQEIRVKEAEIEQAREAQKVADAYVDGANKRAADMDLKIEAALTGQFGGCADAPIDPALLRAVGGLHTP